MKGYSQLRKPTAGQRSLAGRLEQYFTDPNKPTKNEIVLFELEHGDIYNDVISIYNIINDSFKGG